MSRDGYDRRMPDESAAVDVGEAEVYVDAVGISAPIYSGVESEGFIFKESVSHAIMRDSSGVVETSDFPMFKFLFSPIFTLL